MVSGSPSNFGRTREVAKHGRSVRVSPSATLACRVLSKLPSGPITRWALANHEPSVKEATRKRSRVIYLIWEANEKKYTEAI